MMDVNQRKMFKTRPARDKLNRMGGIMASSAPLMNTVAQYNQKRGVQNFQLGGGVQLPLLAEDQARRDLIEAVDQRFPQRNVFGRGATGGARPRGASLLQRTRVPLSLAARSTVPGALVLGAADLALGEGVDREGIMANTARVQPLLAREGFTQKQFDALSPEQQQSLFQTEQDRRLALGTVAGSIGQEVAILPDVVQNLYEDVVGSDIVQRGLKAAGIIDPTSQFERTGRRDFEEGVTRFKAENIPFDNIAQFRASLPLDPETEAERVRQSFMGRSTRPPNPAFDSADVTRADPIEAATDIDKTTAIAATETGPEKEEKEPTPAFDSADGTGTEEKRLTAEQAAATESGQFLDEDSDAITEEARIANVINSNDQELQQGELQRLMAEFTENAPEYEGTSKGLAIAKIGFAMAAGQSPNAITNIASALSDGADMLIKDKKDRDAFDRQVQLSALQYGLGEQSKIRAQKRADERNIMKFVDDNDEVVTVSIAEYIANGRKIPEGLRTTDMYTQDQKAIVERAKATAKALNEANKRKFLTRTEVRADREAYAKAYDVASQAENTAYILETVMKMNADGELTGAANALKTGAAKVGAFLGIEVPDSFNNKQLAITKLKGALQGVIKVTLAGTQSANSISNRDVDLLIQGFLADGVMSVDSNGVLTFANVPAEVINQSLKNGLQAVRQAQAKALNDMSAIEGELAGMFTPQGLPGASILEPYQQVDIRTEIKKRGGKTLSFDKETNLYSAVDVD